jgi:hypothetical protein
MSSETSSTAYVRPNVFVTPSMRRNGAAAGSRQGVFVSMASVASMGRSGPRCEPRLRRRYVGRGSASARVTGRT